MRLNQFLAKSGLGSRRSVEVLIRSGQISVNGKQAGHPGLVVHPDDIVTFEGKRIHATENAQYFLINKPLPHQSNKAFPTEYLPDVSSLTPIHPLPEHASGLMLFTNDQALIEKLTKEDLRIKTVYEIELDTIPTNLDNKEKMSQHIDHVDIISKDHNELQIIFRTGSAEEIALLFDQMKVSIKRLDRIYYCGLTKKDLPRGRFRSLNETEIRRLRFFNQL